MKRLPCMFYAYLLVACALLTLCAWVSRASAQTCLYPPAGLVAWWPGDGDANDIAGNTHGTLLGGAAFVTGLVGQAFSFNGTDAAVDTLPTNIMNFLPLTIEAWVQPALRTDDTAFVPNNAVSNDNQSSSGHGFGVNVYATHSRLDIEYQDGFRQVSGASFAAGEWYHVAVVYMAGNFKAYVNGQGVDDFSFSQGALDGSPLVRLGKHNDSVGTYGTERFFKGLLDEVTVYNRALSGEEVAAIYNAGSAGKCKAIVGGVGGSVTGLKPTQLLCRNLTTFQSVRIKDQQISWNCEAAGLAVAPGDEIAIILMGVAE